MMVAQVAEASCMTCPPPKNTKQLHFQLGYQHKCDVGWGKCVTKSGHWQPIKSGVSENLGFIVKGDYDWVKPFVQVKTLDLTVKGSWYDHSTVVDKDKRGIGGADKVTVSKTYYYGLEQTEYFKKVIADVDKGSMLFQVITVTGIT